MVTLTRLFAISIVASVRSLSSLNNSIFLSRLSRSGLRCERSVGERLKNAISEPLARPETTRRIHARTIARITPTVGGTKVTSSQILYSADISNSNDYFKRIKMALCSIHLSYQMLIAAT